MADKVLPKPGTFCQPGFALVYKVSIMFCLDGDITITFSKTMFFAVNIRQRLSTAITSTVFPAPEMVIGTSVMAFDIFFQSASTQMRNSLSIPALGAETLSVSKQT